MGYWPHTPSPYNRPKQNKQNQQNLPALRKKTLAGGIRYGEGGFSLRNLPELCGSIQLSRRYRIPTLSSGSPRAHFDSSGSDRGEPATSDELKSALLSALSVNFKREEIERKVQTGRKEDDTMQYRKMITRKERGEGSWIPAKRSKWQIREKEAKWKQEKL